MTAAARFASRQAAEAWTAQNALASQLISGASSLGSSSRMAAEQAKIDYESQLADLRKQEMQVTAEIDQLKQTVAHAQQQIDQLKAKQFDAEAKTWAAMTHHMYAIADALANGIARQFPGKFS